MKIAELFQLFNGFEVGKLLKFRIAFGAGGGATLAANQRLSQWKIMRLDARDSAPEQLGGAVHSESAHLSQSATGTSAVVLLSSDPSHLPVLPLAQLLLCSIFSKGGSFHRRKELCHVIPSSRVHFHFRWGHLPDRNCTIRYQTCYLKRTLYFFWIFASA